MSVQTLVPARFSCLMLHLVATSAIFHTRGALLSVTIDPRDTASQQYAVYQNNETTLFVLLAVSYICFAIELAGFASGLTLHQIGLHLCCTVLHLAGVACVLAMVLNVWTAEAYKFIFGFFVLVPALMDSFVVFFHMIVRGKILEFMEIRL
eukprot:TRINITY_DN934_c0_g2_i1.p1 TRINITY_DN934_c0_g2~~TRINITY_DN934_c0_g2_i1.p1  ORF type:complete len:167 (-),score=37.81 TRINITY_DN934_c0_g2_i1:765-1217(-)